MNRNLVAFALACLTSRSARAEEVSASPLASLESILRSTGTHRVARTRNPSADGFTLTAAADDRASWFCLEAARSEPRCWVVEAPARGFVLPRNPARGYPISLSLAIPVSGNDVENLIVELASPTAEPELAIENLARGDPPPTLPRVYRRETIPSSLARFGELELVHSGGDVTYASHRGQIRACERVAGDIVCSDAVRVGADSERLALDPDAQGPELFELEVERPDAPSRTELVHIVVFVRGADGRLAHLATVPFGGNRRAAAHGGTEVVEVLYEEFEPAGRSCVTIGRAAIEHRIELANGSERRLGPVRLVPVGQWLPSATVEGESLLLDVSGTWELDASRRFHRVARCTSPL